MVLQQFLAESMKRVMILENLTTLGIANKAGIAKSSAQGYLNGQGNPRADTIEYICANLGCSLEVLIASGQPPGPPDELPDFQPLAVSIQTIHPLLRPVICCCYQMIEGILLLSDVLRQRDKERNGSEE